MFAATAMLMIYRWAQEQEHGLARGRRDVPLADHRRVRGEPTLGNRRMAIGLLAFSATVLVITFSVVLSYHDTGTRHIGIDPALAGF